MNTPDQPAGNSFKDIIVDGSYNLDVLAKGGIYQEEPSGIMPSSSTSNNEQLETLRKHSKIVKWTSVFLCLATLFYLIPGAWPLVLTFGFPISGFVAGHKFSDCLLKFYLVYLFVIIIMQVILMGVIGNPPYIVMQTLVLVTEIIVIFFSAKLVIGLGKLNPTDLSVLTGK